MENVATQILENIKLLEQARNTLRERAEAKSSAIAEYDKKLAITIIKLRNGVELEIDGEKMLNPAVSVTEKLAKGYCWKEKLEEVKADAFYKNSITAMQGIQAIMNALQSINRYQSEA